MLMQPNGLSQVKRVKDYFKSSLFLGLLSLVIATAPKKSFADEKSSDKGAPVRTGAEAQPPAPPAATSPATGKTRPTQPTRAPAAQQQPAAQPAPAAPRPPVPLIPPPTNIPRRGNATEYESETGEIPFNVEDALIGLDAGNTCNHGIFLLSATESDDISDNYISIAQAKKLFCTTSPIDDDFYARRRKRIEQTVEKYRTASVRGNKEKREQMERILKNFDLCMEAARNRTAGVAKGSNLGPVSYSTTEFGNTRLIFKSRYGDRDITTDPGYVGVIMADHKISVCDMTDKTGATVTPAGNSRGRSR